MKILSWFNEQSKLGSIELIEHYREHMLRCIDFEFGSYVQINKLNEVSDGLHFKTFLRLLGTILYPKAMAKYVNFTWKMEQSLPACSNLSWKEQIASVEKKVAQGCHALFKLQPIANISLLRKVYFSLIYSYLQYAILIWGNVPTSYLKHLNIIAQSLNSLYLQNI